MNSKTARGWQTWNTGDEPGLHRGAGQGRRKTFLRRFATVTVASLLAASMAPLAAVPALAATAGMSPVDPQNGFPTWYSDGNVKLQLCYMAGAGCLAEPPDPNSPASYPDNFPEEAFWFNAGASGGKLGLYEAALEGAHLNGVVTAGEQMGFGRLRFIVEDLQPGASYTITHPYGVNTFVAEQDPKVATAGRIKQTIDAGVCAPTPQQPCDWAGVGQAFLGDNSDSTTSTFLKQVGAAPGTLGDINTARAVTGAPTGNNFVRVDGPDAGGPGVNTLTVNTFTVQGLIFNGADAAPSTPDLAPASDSGKSGTDNITNVTRPTLTGTVPGVGVSEATVELLVDGATAPAATTTTTAGAYSVLLDTALTSGTHRVQARTPNPEYTVDPATGEPVDPTIPQYLISGTLTFKLDTVAPPVAIVAPFPSNPTADTTPTVNFTSPEPSVSFECQLVPSNPDWDPTCASPKSYDPQLNGTYTFNVRATDPAGNVGTQATRTWTIGPADTIAPTLSAQSPSSNASGVPMLNTISVRFSEPVRNVDASTFILQDPAGAIVPSTVTFDTATNQAVLDPTNPLAGSTRYTVSLKNTIADLSGNQFAGSTWAFTTTDTTLPTVTSRSPLTGATGVSTTGNMTATFSEAVQGVSGTTFTLRNAAGTATAATVSYNATTRVATLDPTATLAANTNYTATLTGSTTSIRDTANNPLATTSWSFTTGAAPDTTAPTATSRSPLTGATGVSTSGNVTATFSEAVQGVSGTTFALRNAAGTVTAATVSYNATTRVATLDPTATLVSDTRYTVALTGGATGIRDAAGNPLATQSWAFTTGPAPSVTGRTPGINATAVSTTGNITATLSESVAGISGTTFALRNAAGTTVAATVSYNATTRVATLNPTATLASDTRYTATLTGGATAIRDAAGNPLATQSWSFTTGPAPTVTGRTPGINATAVSRTGNITATFSEAVTGVSGATVALRTSAGAAVTAVVSYNTTTRVATLNPSATLTANTSYRVTLTGSTTALRDIVGNPLLTTTWNFTTGP
ncbi:Ig-like domain-containing protein [Arthrobacter sp. Hz1]